jgi:hypothetical protein
VESVVRLRRFIYLFPYPRLLDTQVCGRNILEIVGVNSKIILTFSIITDVAIGLSEINDGCIRKD